MNYFKIAICILFILCSQACMKKNKSTQSTSTTTVSSGIRGFGPNFEQFMSVHPGGKFLYVFYQKDYANPLDFHTFLIDSTTKQATLSQSTDMSEQNSYVLDDMMFHPNGLYFYAAYANPPLAGPIKVFSVDQTTGALTLIQTVTGTANANSTKMVYLSSGHLVTADWSGVGAFKLSVYSVAANGTLSLVNQTSVNSYYRNMLVHPNELLFFGMSADAKQIDSYKLNTSDYSFTLEGSLTLDTSINYPQTSQISSNGKFLYILQSWPGSKIYRYSINQTTGVLTTLSDYEYHLKGYSSRYDSGEVATPSGEFAAIQSGYDSSNDLLFVNTCTYKIYSVFKIDKNSGDVEYRGSNNVQVAGSTCNLNPNVLKMDPSFKYAYLFQKPDSASPYTIQTYQVLDTGGLVLKY